MNSVQAAPVAPNALDAAVDINDFFDGEGLKSVSCLMVRLLLEDS
jgi:hypothetical protein